MDQEPATGNEKKANTNETETEALQRERTSSAFCSNIPFTDCEPCLSELEMARTGTHNQVGMAAAVFELGCSEDGWMLWKRMELDAPGSRSSLT